MKSFSSFAALITLTTACLSLGCQVPSTTRTEGPKIEVNHGTLKVNPNADLALRFTVGDPDRDCYSVLQAGGVPTGVAAKIVTTVSGPTLATPKVHEETNISCNPFYTLNLLQLPPGTYTVTVNVLDASNNIVAYDSDASVVVQANQRTVVDLQCATDVTGEMTINFECNNCMTPRDPIQEGLASYISGFAVDSAGTVHLFAEDPNWVPALPSENCGRIVPIPANLAHVPVILDGDFDVAVQGTMKQISGVDVLYTVPWRRNAAGQFSSPNLAYNMMNGTKIFDVPASGLVAGYGGNTVVGNPTATQIGQQLWGAYGTAGQPGLQIYEHVPGGSPVNRRFIYQSITINNTIQPYTMKYTSDDRIMWSANNGIFYLPFDKAKYDANPREPQPYNLGPLNTTYPGPAPTEFVPNTTSARGFELIQEDGSKVLFAQGSKIHYWESANPAPATHPIVWESAYGNVYRIEKGLDGKYYAMLFSPNLPHENYTANWWYHDEVRVLRFHFDAATSKLVYEATMVDSFPDGSPESHTP